MTVAELISLDTADTDLAHARYSIGRSTLSQVLLTTTWENDPHRTPGSSQDTELDSAPSS